MKITFRFLALLSGSATAIHLAPNLLQRFMMGLSGADIDKMAAWAQERAERLP